jgi:hypothetical protein
VSEWKWNRLLLGGERGADGTGIGSGDWDAMVIFVFFKVHTPPR